MALIKHNVTTIQPKVIILLCGTHDVRFIDEQLLSIRNQKNCKIEIIVSIDLDYDYAHPIWYEKLSKLFPTDNFQIFKGPNKGYVTNFLTVIKHADISADYFSFSDQDDIWEDNKLEQAIVALRNLDKDYLPMIYCGRTRLVDKENNEIGFSKHFKKEPSFQNALVQSIAGGNTMTLNRKALELLILGSRLTNVVSHDWWAYILVTGAGGRVIYDSIPYIRYRQHDKNLVGANKSYKATIKRIIQVFNGSFKKWQDINLAALHNVRHLLTNDNQLILDYFNTARSSSCLKRFLYIVKSGIYRQTFSDNIALTVAIILNRI